MLAVSTSASGSTAWPTDAYQPSRRNAIEELPLALGFAIVNGGAFRRTIEDGINSGRDTDSIGVMAGAILGAMHGEAVIEPHEATQIDTINRLDLAGEAETFSRTAWTILEDAEARYRAIARERTALCNATEDDRV